MQKTGNLKKKWKHFFFPAFGAKLKQSLHHLQRWLTAGWWKFKNLSQTCPAEQVQGGIRPVNTGWQVASRLIKNARSVSSCLYECQSGSPWKQTEMSLRPEQPREVDLWAALSVNYWPKILCIWNLNKVCSQISVIVFHDTLPQSL